MATKITLTLPKDLTDRDQEDLRSILKDAFHEFATKRYPATDYVSNRYPDTGAAERNIKAQQVIRRSTLARALHDAAFSVDVRIQHVNHAICLAQNKACSQTCFMQGEDTVSEIVQEGVHRTKYNLELLQTMFGLTEEEALGTCRRLEDERLHKYMERMCMAKTPYTEKRRKFEELLAHEAGHHAAGTKPDIEGLTKALVEMFS